MTEVIQSLQSLQNKVELDMAEVMVTKTQTDRLQELRTKIAIVLRKIIFDYQTRANPDLIPGFIRKSIIIKLKYFIFFLFLYNISNLNIKITL